MEGNSVDIKSNGYLNASASGEVNVLAGGTLYADGNQIEIPSSFKSTDYGLKFGYNLSEKAHCGGEDTDLSTRHRPIQSEVGEN